MCVSDVLELLVNCNPKDPETLLASTFTAADSPVAGIATGPAELEVCVKRTLDKLPCLVCAAVSAVAPVVVLTAGE